MKTARAISLALCLLLLVLPSLAIPVFRSQTSREENRTLASFPSLTDAEGKLNREFDAEFEAWLCDHFAFRPQAVYANAWLHYRLLHDSVNEQVVPGAGDWLYFRDTVPDYTGEGRLTGEELARMADNLGALSRALQARGTRLYAAIVPNKSTVYPQFMPERYRMRGDEGNIPLLRDALAELPITWIDLVTPLREAAKGDLPVYCRTDTHWNALGAAIAADAVLRAMGREAAGYELAGQSRFSGGDLARLMGLSDGLSETVPAVTPARPLPEADFDRHVLTVRGDGEGRLVVYRDSFGTAVGPWLCAAYGESALLWQRPLDGSVRCDDALLLICERNLREYLLDPPELGGPEAEEDEPEAAEEAPEPPDGSFEAFDGEGGFFDDDSGNADGDSEDVSDGSFEAFDGEGDFFDDDSGDADGDSEDVSDDGFEPFEGEGGFFDDDAGRD